MKILKEYKTFQIKLSDEDINFATDLGKRRSASMGHKDTKNSKNFFANKPPWHRHVVGAIGEVAFAKVTGQKVDTKTIGRGDGGVDFKNGVQIKSTEKKFKPDLIISKRQFNMTKGTIYVLAWIKLPVVEFVGWISRQKFDQLKTLKRFQHGEAWVVKHELLNKVK